MRQFCGVAASFLSVVVVSVSLCKAEQRRVRTTDTIGP